MFNPIKDWCIARKRMTEITPKQFSEFLQDKKFQQLVENAKDQMEFGHLTEDSGNEYPAASSFSPGKRLKYTIKRIQRWMDEKKVRVTADGILFAIVHHMDPDGSLELDALAYMP